MKEFMNAPVEAVISDREVYDEYLKCGEVKSISKIFLIPVKRVREIIKSMENS